ncbi:hypothetical protein [Modestobacter lapidis]|nr:hypothetical protein [Modestobacter lapidis]
MTTGDASRRALWPSRCLTGGRLVITREDVPNRVLREDGWVQRRGDDWRRLPGWQQWAIAALVFVLLQSIVSPWGVVVLLAHVVFLALTGVPEATPGAVTTPPAEAQLAALSTVEARVAGAACRAWAETIDEPAWQSPYLRESRAAFDMRAEVDRIVDLALRIHATRRQLGPRPQGALADYWEQQWAALDRAGVQLGHRADALIRYRDQAADLSVELRHLADLERLERSAAEIDGLTVETARSGPVGLGGMDGVEAQLIGVRQAMTDLLDLMTRTRAPLLTPPDAGG